MLANIEQKDPSTLSEKRESINTTDVLHRRNTWVRDTRPESERNGPQLQPAWVQEFDYDSGHLWLRTKYTHNDIFFWIGEKIKPDQELPNPIKSECGRYEFLNYVPSEREIYVATHKGSK